MDEPRAEQPSNDEKFGVIDSIKRHWLGWLVVTVFTFVTGAASIAWDVFGAEIVATIESIMESENRHQQLLDRQKQYDENQAAYESRATRLEAVADQLRKNYETQGLRLNQIDRTVAGLNNTVVEQFEITRTKISSMEHSFRADVSQFGITIADGMKGFDGFIAETTSTLAYLRGVLAFRPVVKPTEPEE